MKQTLVTNLAKALQRYYERKGNKIIFLNGMTLNQLALEMWEGLGYQGVDASVVSRVLRGERIFTYKQFRVFSKILKFSKREYLRLEEARGVSFQKRLGFNYDPLADISSKSFIDLMEKNIEKITEFNRLGRLSLTEDWVNALLEVIDLGILRTFNEERMKKLLCLKAQVLIKQNNFLQNCKPRGEVLSLIIKNSKEVIKIGKDVDRSSLVCIANMLMGDTFYINAKYKEALPYLSESLKLYDKRVGALILGWTPVRSLALCYAYLNDLGKYDYFRRQLLEEVEESNPENKVTIYEGLARAEANIGRTMYIENYLTKAHKVYEEIKRTDGPFKIIIPIFLTRTKIEAGKLLGIYDHNYLEKEGKMAIQAASKYGYHRYTQTIKELLDETLN